MHTRSPSFTFTSVSLFAQANWKYPGDNLPVTFYQGSTVQLEVVLSTDSGPLDLSTHRLDFVLKKATNAENVIYREEIKTTVADKAEGTYRVVLPKVVTSNLRPGVYYFAFVATDRASGYVYPPYTGTFSLELSAASPNPSLDIQDGEPTADGTSGAADEKLSPAEITGPDTPDLGRQF